MGEGGRNMGGGNGFTWMFFFKRGYEKGYKKRRRRRRKMMERVKKNKRYWKGIEVPGK